MNELEYEVMVSASPRTRPSRPPRPTNRMNYLTPLWDYPACTRCAGCSKPIELAWTSSCLGHAIYHGKCYERKDHE